MEDAQLRLASALADRYAVERVLAQGGMATVYLAKERKHDRYVALKTIRADFGPGFGTERFHREIEIGAHLLHPNILPLYDSGVADGMLFYVMPYLEGETLADRLRRERQLPVEDAVAIAREVADALTHAHARGVIHRDIKPENILFSSGHAMVADFGVARDTSRTTGSFLSGGRFPRSGTSSLGIGTPEYMSPEQADGEADARSDVYALGCVLYEMLVGEPPFTGPTVEAILSRHAVAPIPPIHVVRPGVPRALENAVSRALSKLPEDRFTTAAEFRDAITTAVSRAALPSARSAVGVLPFVNIGGDAEGDYFADGLTEELIAALSRVPGLRLASRTSTFAFKGKKADVRVVGERLSVGMVVEGSVRREGGTLRVTAQVTSVSDGLAVWSGSFERKLEDVFLLQEELARAIAREFRASLTGGRTGPLILTRTEDVEAYHAYWRGRYFWNLRTPQGLTKAIACYHDALKRDAQYAAAYAGLADAYIAWSQFQLRPPRDVLPQAEESARRALEFDPDLPEARTSLAHILEVYHWKWSEAESEYQRALEFGPQYATAHAWYADLLQGMNRLDEAAERMRVAQTLEPLSVAIDFQAAQLLYRSRKFEEAITKYERIIDMAPGLVFAHLFLGFSLCGLGERGRAEAVLREAMSTLGPWIGFVGGLGFVLGRAARIEEANEMLARIDERAKSEYVATVFPTLVHLGTGDEEGALRRLESAFQERSLLMQWLKVEPFLDPVRHRPEFDDLIKRVHG